MAGTIVSDTFSSTTSTLQLYAGNGGTSYISVQNHDAANYVIVTFGGKAAVAGASPNGVKVKAGEFLEIQGNSHDFSSPINVIADTATVKLTFLHN